jgi:formate hydrogenlyase subunit 4
MESVVQNALHMIIAFGMPPLLLGVIAKTKAVFAGRAGPPILQPYFDLTRLFRKESVFSTTTNWVFLAGPVVGVVTIAIIALLIPLGGSGAPISFKGDFILFAYLLSLGRFFAASAALDTGSAFEGMGAARELTFACFAEPAFFLGLLVLAKLSGSLQLSDMLGGSIGTHWGAAGDSLALVVLSWSIVMLVENSRMPFDDPNTHLELTMIHEVMVLDHSGPAFGLIIYGAALKLFVFGSLMVRLILPVTSHPWLGWPVFVAAMLVVAVVIGIVESTMARLRLSHVPVLLLAASLLSGFGMILLMR